MVKPITPDEVRHVIPDFVIQAFNQLISEKWNGEEAIIKQDEIMNIISSSGSEEDDRPSRLTIYQNNWLDVEDLYRDAGWNVDYDKPAYCESYKPYFKFTKK